MSRVLGCVSVSAIMSVFCIQYSDSRMALQRECRTSINWRVPIRSLKKERVLAMAEYCNAKVNAWLRDILPPPI